MKLAFTHRYPAQPDAVAALMRNEDFIADVAQHAGAIEHSCEIAQDTVLRMTLPAPENARPFVGTKIPIEISLTFAEADSTGSIPGAVILRVSGAPVDAEARVLLAPAGDSTVGKYDGELKVHVPLFGKKVESAIEPFIIDAFDGIRRRAQEWLLRD